jgi:DNA-3-methyladenine glycosylase II
MPKNLATTIRGFVRLMKLETLTLTPKAPFDFRHTLNFLQDFKADGIHRIVQDGSLRFAIQILGQPVAVQLTSTGTVKKPRLELTLYSRQLSDTIIETTSKSVRFYLSLDDDLTPFYKLAEKDPAFKPVVKTLYGYHQVKYPSIFASVCWALVTQRTPNSFAYLTMQRFCELLGDSITVNGERFTTFPEPEKFLKNSEKILLATNNTRKTDRLLEIAKAFTTADEHFLKTAPYEEVLRYLKKIKGLGQWSAEYILLRGLGRYERTPWTDTVILESISNLYTGGFRISEGDAKRLAEHYGWYQGLWFHYLKRFVDD